MFVVSSCVRRLGRLRLPACAWLCRDGWLDHHPTPKRGSRARIDRSIDRSPKGPCLPVVSIKQPAACGETLGMGRDFAGLCGPPTSCTRLGGVCTRCPPTRRVRVDDRVVFSFLRLSLGNPRFSDFDQTKTRSCLSIYSTAGGRSARKQQQQQQPTPTREMAANNNLAIVNAELVAGHDAVATLAAAVAAVAGQNGGLGGQQVRVRVEWCLDAWVFGSLGVTGGWLDGLGVKLTSCTRRFFVLVLIRSERGLAMGTS